MPDRDGAVGLTLDSDLIECLVDGFNSHLLRFDSNCRIDSEFGSVADLNGGVVVLVATNVLVGRGSGILFGNFESIEDKFPRYHEEFSERGMFGA